MIATTNVIVFNLKKRMTGVSTTILTLQPQLERMRDDVVYVGAFLKNAMNAVFLFLATMLTLYHTLSPHF